MEPLILSTHNDSKTLQISTVFTGTLFSVKSLKQMGISEKATEDGETLEENGLKKAMFAHERFPSHYCMSDDSGIFIDVLNGFPGVHSADWMGEDASTEAIMQGILEKMKGVENRAAAFRTVATLVSPDGTVKTFKGEVKGKLLAEPRGVPQTHMPYSPLFMPDGYEKVWTEMTVEEENEVSHRGKAFAQVRDFLLTTINS